MMMLMRVMVMMMMIMFMMIGDDLDEVHDDNHGDVTAIHRRVEAKGRVNLTDSSSPTWEKSPLKACPSVERPTITTIIVEIHGLSIWGLIKILGPFWSPRL